MGFGEVEAVIAKDLQQLAGHMALYTDALMTAVARLLDDISLDTEVVESIVRVALKRGVGRYWEETRKEEGVESYAADLITQLFGIEDHAIAIQETIIELLSGFVTTVAEDEGANCVTSATDERATDGFCGIFD